MASAVRQIVSSIQLSASAASLYVSTAVWTQIAKVTATNADTNTHSLTLYIVPSGGSVGTANASTDAQPIIGGDTFNSPNEVGLVLNPGDALWGKADTASVMNLFVSGIVLT